MKRHFGFGPPSKNNTKLFLLGSAQDKSLQCLEKPRPFVAAELFCNLRIKATKTVSSLAPRTHGRKAHRNPMLLFVFEAELFRFAVNKPSFVVLFQLPPRKTAPADAPRGEALTPLLA